MKITELIENNLIIANFMGAEVDENFVYFTELTNPRCIDDTLHKSDLLYDSSWDWLMPVVEKIESITLGEDNSFNIMIGATTYCVIQDSNGECYEMIHNGEETKLLCVYKAVVEFIKWYNENK